MKNAGDMGEEGDLKSDKAFQRVNPNKVVSA